jgi:hypothetical protein
MIHPSVSGVEYCVVVQQLQVARLQLPRQLNIRAVGDGVDQVNDLQLLRREGRDVCVAAGG